MRWWNVKSANYHAALRAQTIRACIHAFRGVICANRVLVALIVARALVVQNARRDIQKRTATHTTATHASSARETLCSGDRLSVSIQDAPRIRAHLATGSPDSTQSSLAPNIVHAMLAQAVTTITCYLGRDVCAPTTNLKAASFCASIAQTASMT